MNVKELKEVLKMYEDEDEVVVCINCSEGYVPSPIVSHDIVGTHPDDELGGLGLFINLYHFTPNQVKGD